MSESTRAVSKSETIRIDYRDIVLREYQLADLDALCAITREPKVTAFLPDWNVPREVRLDWLVNYELAENQRFLQVVTAGESIGKLRLRLAIVSKKTEEFIGWCCTGIREELPAPNREIMYAVSDRYSGQGYATQAVQGLVSYLFEHTDAVELGALALTHNGASNRVLQKSGFELQGTLEIDQQSYHCYKIVHGTIGI